MNEEMIKTPEEALSKPILEAANKFIDKISDEVDEVGPVALYEGVNAAGMAHQHFVRALIACIYSMYGEKEARELALKIATGHDAVADALRNGNVLKFVEEELKEAGLDS